MTDVKESADDLPRAVPDAPRSKRMPFVWILPVLVVIVGGFVVIEQKLARGTSIEIDFQSADGLEANKTKVRYKDVDIGDVTDIQVSKDRKKVVVTARIHRNASDYLVEDTRFWVVRPRLTGGGVTGLGTLVSGAYISLDVGQSQSKKRSFSGLEVPPIVTSDFPGREYILHADDIGSLSVGSTVFYRHITVGQVIAYALDPGGTSVTIKIFVYEPFDNYVGAATRFWQASGIDMSINSDGVKLQTESLTSILQGGVAFQSPPQAPVSVPVAADTPFTLFTDRERALRQSESEVRTFIMYFAGSLRGLSVGAPVDLRGITIGEVKSLSVEYERDAGTLRFPVQVDIYPQRIRGRSRRNDRTAPADETSETASRTLVDSLVAHGMRAEVRTGNLLTGQKYVAMDFHNEVPPDHVGWNAQPPVFPTTSGALDEIQDSVGSIAKKLDKVPFDQIAAHLVATLSILQDTLKNSDHLIRQVDGTLAPQVSATLKEAEGAMKSAKEVLAEDAPLQTDLTSTLLQLSRAAKSVSALVDYLERQSRISAAWQTGGRKVSPKLLWAAGSVIALLAACVGEHDHFYTLSVLPNTRQGALSAPVKHAILSVTIPSLADRSEMIVQNGDHGIEVLDHRRWGEPLADQISQTLARDLEQRRSDLLIGGRGFDQPGDPPLRIRIDIVRLSASMGGQATIEAHWRIEGGTLDVLGGDSFSTSIQGRNFDALAVAYSNALAKLADELAPLLPR